MDKEYDEKDTKGKGCIKKGEKTMAVSKATLSCVKGDVGTRLIEDIKSTKVNKNIVKTYKSLMEKLAKGEFSK